MRTGRHPLTFPALLAAVLLLGLAGCKKGSSGSSSGGGSDYDLTAFPGAPVGDGDVGDDGKGFSPPGTDMIAGSLKCTPNGDRGTMMVTYGVMSGDPPVVNLIAQYYDGESWTPPVVLGATDASSALGSVTFSGVVHGWLNTSENAADTASDRDGDCVIFWQARDADDDGILTPDGVNRNLYSTYFNARQSTDISKAFGFQTSASRLSVEDEAGEDVTSFGIATDGLIGEARWEVGRNSYRYGEETSGMVVFWNQRENVDAKDGFEDRALYYCTVALDAPVTSDLPLTAGAGIGAPVRLVIASLGGSDAGTSSAETQVDTCFITYNNVLAFRVAANNLTSDPDVATHVFDGGASDYNGPSAAGEDASLEAVSFDLAAGTVSTAVVLHSSAPVSSTTDSLRNDADFIHRNAELFTTAQPSMFGPDEGIAVVVLLSAESIDDTNDSKADPADAGGLAVSEIDPATGALLSHGLVSTGDPAVSDFVDSRNVSARISRNGDYLLVAWLQDAAGSSFIDRTLFAAQYLTTRPDGDGLFVLPALGASLSAPVPVNAETDGFDVQNFAWQEGLAYVCGGQSDPDVMNLAWSHPDAAGDRLFSGKVLASREAPVAPAATPTLLASCDSAVWALAPAVNDAGQEYRIIDSGEGGNVFAVYNIDIDATGSSDIRVHARRTGLAAGSGPVDSNVDFREAGHQNFTLIGTPAGESIGLFDPVSDEDSGDRPHGFSRIHLFFREQKTSVAAGTGMALRTRAFDTSDNGLTFGNSFTPNAGDSFADPFDLDLPLIDPAASEDAEVRGITVEEDSVGVFFTETGHIWYQEFHDNGAALGWINDTGVSTPLLVDDDVTAESESDDTIASFELFVTRTGTCSTLHGATVFFTKIADDGTFNERLRVRIRE